jgi:hypothetical protein
MGFKDVFGLESRGVEQVLPGEAGRGWYQWEREGGRESVCRSKEPSPKLLPKKYFFLKLEWCSYIKQLHALNSITVLVFNRIISYFVGQSSYYKTIAGFLTLLG